MRVRPLWPCGDAGGVHLDSDLRRAQALTGGMVHLGAGEAPGRDGCARSAHACVAEWGWEWRFGLVVQVCPWMSCAGKQRNSIL